VQALQTITPGRDVVARMPRSHPIPMSGSSKTQNCSASWQLARATVSYSHQQELHRDDGVRKWYFPSAFSEATHVEWTVRQILLHLRLFSGIRQLNEEMVSESPRPREHCPDVGGDHHPAFMAGDQMEWPLTS